MNMKISRIFPPLAVLCLCLSITLAQAASVTGTVTNKTTGKPSAGDTVTLVDVQAGMSDAATATTDAKGHYTLQSPGGGAFLVKATHQGGSYFIAAPQGDVPGDITVYDVAAKVEGVSIDANMILAEAAGGMVRVQERYLVRNTSLPPRAQFSSNTFEFVLPAGAILDGASATRPGGLPTNTRPTPLSQKGHYTINIPIQPNKGEKETLFEVQYHLSFNGKVTFTPQPLMPADNLVVYVPKGMTFGGAKGADFQKAEQDPRVQTFIAKNIHPGQAIEFTLSGEGQMPREAQNSGMGQQAIGGMGDAGSAETGNKPGGGIGNPIDTPDPLSKYKWWIIGALALLLVAAAGYLLRKQGASAPALPATLSDAAFEEKSVRTGSAPAATPQASHSTAQANYSAAPAAGKSALLNALKEEMFAIESERLSGTISAAEYAEVKNGLEAVLKRALKSR